MDPNIRRVADHGVEAGVVAGEDFREALVPIERVDPKRFLLVEQLALAALVVVAADQGVSALDAAAQIGEGALVKELELGIERLVALPLEHFEKERELCDLDRLGVDVHAEDRVQEDALAFSRRQPPLAAGRLVEHGLASLARFRVLLRAVADVPVAVPVEQALIGAQQERPGTARRVEDLEVGSLLRRRPLQQLADRVLDDVVNDVGGRVVDAAGLLDLRLVLDLGAVPLRQPDDLAEELLVDLPEDVGGKHRELVRRVGVVEVADDVLEDLVVDGEGGRQGVRALREVLLALEVKQAGVVPFVGTLEQLEEAAIGVRAIERELELELPVGLDASVLADAQEDDPVDRPLHREVQLAHRELLVAKGDIARQLVPPALDLLEELGVNRRGPALALGRNGEAVERALEDGVLGEDARDLRPPIGVLLEGQVVDAGDGARVGLLRLDTAVVYRQLAEVGEQGERQLGRPGVAPELVRGVRLVLDRHRRLLRFEEELPGASDAEAVVRGLGRAADLDRVLVDDIFVRLGVPSLVVDVPAEQLEHRVDELGPDLCLVVRSGFVRREVAIEPFDKLYKFFGSRHRASPRDLTAPIMRSPWARNAQSRSPTGRTHGAGCRRTGVGEVPSPGLRPG